MLVNVQERGCFCFIFGHRAVVCKTTLKAIYNGFNGVLKGFGVVELTFLLGLCLHGGNN